MTALAEKIYDEVLDLPTEQRLGLIDKLLEKPPGNLNTSGSFASPADQ